MAESSHGEGGTHSVDVAEACLEGGVHSNEPVDLEARRDVALTERAASGVELAHANRLLFVRLARPRKVRFEFSLCAGVSAH